MGINFHMLYRIGKSNSMDIIYGVSLHGGGDDKMCWKPSKKRGFEVRGYYRVLIRNSDQLFPWKSKWKSKIHSRVGFFVWTAALGKILTIGDWYLDHLEFFGQCQGWLLTYKPVGKVGLVSIEMVSFGWLLPIV